MAPKAKRTARAAMAVASSVQAEAVAAEPEEVTGSKMPLKNLKTSRMEVAKRRLI